MDKPPTTPISLFKARVYDVLANRQKLQPIAPIGTLNGEDSAVCTAICMAAEKMAEDMVMEAVEMGLDGICLTLLAVYQNGLPQGPQFPNENLRKLAEILEKAGMDGRAEDDRSAGERDERGPEGI